MNRSFPVIIALIALTAGCVSQPDRKDKDEAVVLPDRGQQAQPEDIQELLVKAERASPENAYIFRVRAAELAVENQDIQQAKLILELIQRPLPTTALSRRYLIARAKLALLNDEPRQAIKWTQDEKLRSVSLDKETELELGKIRAQAYFNARSYVASARERIFYSNLLPEQERTQNHDLIFSTLLKVPVDSLANQATDAVSSDLRGWLSLAAMTKRHQDNPLKQLKELQRWQQLWSQHPAASDLPAGLDMLPSVVNEQPDSIALLLPLQGDLRPYGQAIRDGILGAHYELDGTPRIRVYDTAPELNIASLIRRAREDGAELIIGPLSRERVTQIAKIEDLNIPVLALNRTDGTINPNLYQFGLAPEDEMIQVAERAYEEGHRKALAIYPADQWGERNFHTFKEHWKTLGGTVVASTDFAEQKDYSEMVKSLLNVDKSEQRATELRRISGQQFEFTPRRREDIDFIFLLGSQHQARGINPTLAFYYADDLPVYSTSHVYQGSHTKIETIDLNGIRFCDIPWRLTDTGELQRSIQSVWEKASTELAPFYALGVDAYRIYPRLQQLKKVPDQRVFGATGVLRLDTGNIVTRQLMWARFKDGKLISVPTVLGSAAYD
ncbi:MAG: penicillin-binding protein activator [Pseudomonadales bacterium]